MRITDDKGESHRIVENVLKRQFNPDTINTHWVGDITYIRIHAGWGYLACVLDLGSREVVGWSLSKLPNAALAKAALQQAATAQYKHTVVSF